MWNKIKYKPQLIAILVAVIVLIVFLIPEKVHQNQVAKPPRVAETVLKVLYERNTDKRLEYAESQPIIKSMATYLYYFDELMQSDMEKARGPLTVVERRLLYLKNKGLDVDEAKKILRDQVTNYMARKP